MFDINPVIARHFIIAAAATAGILFVVFIFYSIFNASQHAFEFLLAIACLAAIVKVSRSML